MTARKRRGRDTEHLVARAFAGDGWPYAEAVGAGSPGRDIKGVPGVAVEVKARTGFDPLANLRQAVRNAGDDLPVVVMRPNGSGPTTIDDWPTFLPFGVLRRLLRQAGYGSRPRCARVGLHNCGGEWRNHDHESGQLWPKMGASDPERPV